MVDTNLIFRHIRRIPVIEHVENKQGLEQYKQNGIKSLQIGDILEGVLVEKIKSGYVVELDSGIRIPVSVLKDVQLGKLLKLLVQDIKDNEIQVEIAHEEPKELTQKVLEELKLSKTESMKQCIEQFVGKNLPLTREALVQTHYLYKQYQIPAEIIINTLAKNSGLTEKDARVLSNLREHGIGSSIQIIGKIIDEIESPQQLVDVAKILLKNTSEAKEVNIMKEFINDELIVESSQLTELLSQDRNSTLIEKVLDQDQIKDIIDLQGNDSPIIKFIKKIGIENKDEVKQVIHKLYREVMSVATDSSPQILMEKMESIVTKLDELTRYIEKNNIGYKQSEALSNLKEGVEVLHKLNMQGEYFMIPILTHETLSKGEVYFFRPHKKQGNGSKSTYIVIALDLSAINHLEVHIHKVENNLKLDIEVESEEIKHYIAKNIDKLGYEIAALGYTLEQCSYRVCEEQTAKNQCKQFIPSISAMDLKI